MATDWPRLRQFWWNKQLAAGPNASPAEVLRTVGWARSVGGANPYLTLFARAHIDHERAEQAEAGGEIWQLPSARGCVYVLPSEDVVVAHTIGGGIASAAEMRTATKYLDVTESEIAQLGEEVLAALESGPLDPAGLREKLTDRIRSLGEAGRKRGTSSTLPLAIGQLQAQAKIVRTPPGHRLDTNKFEYRIWDDAPAMNLSLDDARARLAELYWGWQGIASIAHFRWFSGFNASQTKKALADLELEQLDDDLLAGPGAAAELEATVVAAEPQVKLVGWLDGTILLRRDLATIAEPGALKVPVLTAQVRGGLTDLPNQAIIDRGELIGVWEWDPEISRIVTCPLVHWNGARRDAVAEQTAITDAFIETLGGHRGASNDSEKSQSQRAQLLRNHQEDLV